MHKTLILLGSTLVFAACNGDTDDTDDTDAGTDNGTDMMEVEYDFRTDADSAYTRVDRIGMPAVATAVITSKDDYNDADPVDDAAGDFVSEIVANIDGLHTALDDDLAGLSLTPCVGGAEGSCVAQGAPLIVPDTISIDLTADAGFPNGRLLADPVIDVTLAVVLLDLSVHTATTFAELPLNPAANDLAFETTFPYLAEAH